ncbi:MAG TPA: DUF2225 domain-containing protein [Gemmatimonadaceae bacterium]|nr:DUF2225 domain-containing protein [Gemmatimonadaceae bacterium]
MTTLHQVELTCPVCEQRFSSQAVLSTNSLGGLQTDFHELAVGAQPLPYLLHTCARCGYTAGETDFGDGIGIGLDVKQHVWGELTPMLPAGPLQGSDKYELAAKVAVWQDAEPRRIADLYLRAAWCCMDESDTEAERYFRRHAAWMFERALASFDAVDRGERARLTYLVAELWRRVGDLARAREWFDKVPSEITDAQSDAWIVREARRQRDCPREWFR